jgi:integrase
MPAGFAPSPQFPLHSANPRVARPQRALSRRLGRRHRKLHESICLVTIRTVDRPLTYETWKRIWRATGTTYKTHDLRHCAASALIVGGASVKQVQMILGHASAAVTLGVYAHLWPGDDDRARGILDAALADCVRTEEVVG